MATTPEYAFSDAVTVFQERRLPEPATLAGYSALIAAYDVKAPPPRRLHATGARHRIYEQDGWRIMTPRHAPPATLEGHLTFALKYEGLDLAVLKRLFLTVGAAAIDDIVAAAPTGGYARRLWFLYEWMTGDRLNRPDASAGRYAPVVSPDLQYAGAGEAAPRYRVRNNLPGTPDFCPLIFRTERLDQFIAMDLKRQAQDVVADVPRNILARTAAFLFLEDSRSSFAIEGESAPQDRIQRWARAIGEAGRRPIDADELIRLQRIVIEDSRFVHLGFREEGGFVGIHDRNTQMPLPDHVSARHQDLEALINGMIAFDKGAAHDLDPVLAAAALAFGFVYVHPFEDGNGRIHRFLIHHVLAERGFNPPGVVFPVSAAILDRIDDYRIVLESYSARLLPLIDWRTTPQFNVELLNDTGDFYRFFDVTPHAEFLYECVLKTIEEDLPNETAFLCRYDQFKARVDAMIDMPERLIDLLFRFLDQNDGQLSDRARSREFAALTDMEAAQIEAVYQDVFAA